MSLGIAIRRIEIFGKNLHNADVGPFEVRDLFLFLLVKRADRVGRQNEKARPDHDVCDPLQHLRFFKIAPRIEKNEEGDEGDNEEACRKRVAPAQKVPGDQHGQVVNVEKHQLLVDKVVDGQQYQ